MFAAPTQNNCASIEAIVKKLSFVITVLLLGLFLGGAIFGAGKIGKKVVLYVHIARLFTREPDRRLAMPVSEVGKKTIEDTWHAPRGADRLHEGQDIFAPLRTPIYSATPGYIYNIGENNLGGNTVSVVGAGGRVYYYAHLDSYARELAEGDRVDTSTVLGYVGTTGNAAGTPPHLHFGVYTPSGAINPLPLLTDRKVEPGDKPKAPATARKDRRQ